MNRALFRPGEPLTRATFKPNGTLDGAVLVVEGEVEILRPLVSGAVASGAEVDEEVGPMFRVRNVDNGQITDAFADELEALP